MALAEPGPVPAITRRDAYAIQREVAAQRCRAGDRVIGYKIGCIGPAIVAQFGMTGPIRGRLYASERRRSGDVISAAGYTNLAIEGEMALRIGDGGLIIAAYPVIELHDFVFEGPRKTLPELIARNGLNTGVVLPRPTVAKPPQAWSAAATMTIRVNGRSIDSGPLWAFGGGAAAALAWLESSLAEEGLSLDPGDLVLTGTCLGLHPLRPGDTVEVAIDDEVCVACDIAT